MALAEVVVLSLAAALLGWFLPRRRLAAVLAPVSLAALFWLQPSSPLRNLDFWLPLASLFLTALTWAVTLAPQSVPRRASIPGLLVVTGFVILLSLTRYLEPLCCLTASRPPGVLPVFLALTAAGTLTGLLLWLPQRRGATWLVFALILAIFVVLKAPSVAENTARAWRTAAGQDPSLAAPNDLVWLGFSFLAFRLLHTLRDAQAG